MFSTILKPISRELAAMSFACCMQLNKNMGVPQRSQLPAFIYCAYTVAIKEEFAFYEPILENGKKSVSSNWWKTSLPRKASTGRQILLFVHRWSTCDAWQHIWFGCFIEEKRSTCHNDSPPSILACNVIRDSASNSERSFVHCYGKIKCIRAKDLNLSFQYVLSKDKIKIQTFSPHVPKQNF